MSQQSKQLSFELKAAGFPQPDPAFGQMWWHPDGCLHVVMKKGEIHIITRYVEDGRTGAGFFNDEALSEMAFAPNAVDILAEMPFGSSLHTFTHLGYEARHHDTGISIDFNPHEAMARRYLAMQAAEAK